jgi:hypothetical protein
MSSTQVSSETANGASAATAVPYRIVQLTPPGSNASIIFGSGVTSDEPGSMESLVTNGRAAGRDPEGRSYGTYAAFNDPDGNRWLLQEITERLPGRV